MLTGTLFRYINGFALLLILILSGSYLPCAAQGSAASRQPGKDALVLNDSNYLFITSGVPGKPYYEAADVIARILNKEFGVQNFKNVIGAGSVDNFDHLANHSTDFIIAQRDVAMERYYDKSDPVRNFEVLMPLFPEAIQIFVRLQGPGHVMSFSEFRDSVKHGSIKKIAIGAKGSLCNKTARDIFSILNVDIPNNRLDERAEELSINDFRDTGSKIDAMVIYSASVRDFNDTVSQARQHLETVGIVSFTADELRPLRDHFENLTPITIDASEYDFLHSRDNDKIESIGTWAFLFINTETYAHLKNDISIPRIILLHILNKTGEDSLYENSHIYKTYANDSFAVLVGKDSIKVRFEHKFDELKATQFFGGLPLSPQLESIFNYHPATHYLELGIILILLSIIAGLLYLYFKERDILRKYWFQYRHWVFTAVIVLVIYPLVIVLLQYFEQQFYTRYLVRSPIMDLTFFDVLKWLALNKLASMGDLYPISPQGKIITYLSSYLAIGSAAYATLFQFYLNHINKKKRMGTQEIEIKDHFVINGWNVKVPELIKGIFEASKNYKDGKKPKIVLITDKIKSTDELNDYCRKQCLWNDLYFVCGDTKEIKYLKFAAVENAKTIILVAEATDIHSDEKSLLRALAINRYVKSAHKSHNDNSYVIAEINDKELMPAFKDAGVDEILCGGELINKIVIQSTFNHGISEIMNNVLTFSDNSEFYTIELSGLNGKNGLGQLHGHTYDQILAPLRLLGVLLVGYKVNYYHEPEKSQEPEKSVNTTEMILDKEEIAKRPKKDNPPVNTGEMILDKDIIAKRLEKDKLTTQFVINPITAGEKEYTLKKTDCIVVLASSEKDILNKIESTDFKTPEKTNTVIL